MAASVATKTNPLLSSLPYILTWPKFNFRTVCSGRLGFSTSTSAGIKVLETFKEEFEIGSRLITLETGKIARFANGSVVLAMEETKVLSTVCSAKGDGVRDFLPLTVEYQEKQFAQGVIPTTFMRREGAPKERELLCGRLIDRPIRPLFPAGFYHEVQVMASVLSSDGKQDPDIMAANATSAALMLSDIPWGGPIGMIRIGRIDGKLIVNPSMDELNISDLNLVYACTRDKTLMMDVQAREISERDLEAALRLAHPEAVKYIEPQLRLAAKAGKQKKEYTLSMVSEGTYEKIRNLAEAPIEAVFTDPSYGKFERGEALENIAQKVKGVLEEEGDEESLKVLSKTVDKVRKEIVRKRIIAEGFRLDGRRLDEVRPLYCEAGNLPELHGSAIFNRGDTQVLCTVTLGAPGDAQQLHSLVGPSTKRFMLHYSFPPFCINEVGKRTGLNRREVGHGTLAEKSLLAVLPAESDFPYTVRINSEVMSSDGSTSMASVCGGSMALMDAGILLKEHVAGVSVGLVSEVDPSSGTIKDYRLLTDILGLEDHLGDMDFKIAGTRNGITAIQLDIKPAGIPLDIICESLEPALKGRLQILDHMEREISIPRTQDGRNTPRLATLKYSNDDLRRLIGPLGALKRKIERETGARIYVGDGTLTVLAKNQSQMDDVQEKVDFIVGREIEKGGVYKGIVSSIKEYGAFVEFNGGQQGLLHISELSHAPVSKVSDVVSIGQKLFFMCIGQDLRGNIKLSLKATLPCGTSEVAEASQDVPKQMSLAPANDGPNQQKKKTNIVDSLPADKGENSGATSSFSSTPAVVIRSVMECDEEEKSSLSSLSTKTSPKIPIASKSDHKLKRVPSQTNVREGVPDEKREITGSILSPSSQPDVVIPSFQLLGDLTTSPKKTNASKSDLNLKRASSQTVSDPSSKKAKSSKPSSVKETKKEPIVRESKDEDRSNSASTTKDDLTEKDSKKVIAMNSEKLKLGMEVTAKVHQVRAGGLVLDLGGGIRGMYRFEGGRDREYATGDEVRVKCSSFTKKGIPVMETKKEPIVRESKDEDRSNSTSMTEDDSTEKDSTAVISMNAKKLKLGTEVTAKVHQVRARGLVLELGGGIRGMYRFEGGGEREYAIGDEVKVKCSSFTTKGTPIMSMVLD